jgi:hypothetical protein
MAGLFGSSLFAAVSVAVSGLAVPAVAASFSCAANLTPFGRIICASPELSGLEEQATERFHAALAGLSPAAADVVNKGQAEWIVHLREACGDDKAIGQLPETPDETSTGCFRRLLTSRLEVLAQNRVTAGYRIYTYDRYAVVRRENPEWGPAMATHDLSVPQFDGPGSTLNDMLVRRFSGDIDARLGSTDQDDTLVVKATTRGTHAVTFEAEDYTYSYGAHGGTLKTFAHYLVDEERFLGDDDIFAGPKWRKALPAIVGRRLARAGYSMFDAKDADFAAAVVAPERWNPRPEGLVVQFEPYEVASYAEGLPAVTVPWSDLRGLIARGFAPGDWR